MESNSADGSPPLKMKRNNLSAKAGSSKDCQNQATNKKTVGKELSEKVTQAKKMYKDLMSNAQKRLDDMEETIAKDQEEDEKVKEVIKSKTEVLSSKKKVKAELAEELLGKDKKIQFLQKRVQEQIKELRDMRKKLKQKTLAKNGSGVILDVDGRMFLKAKLEDVLRIVETSQMKDNVNLTEEAQGQRERAYEVLRALVPIVTEKPKIKKETGLPDEDLFGWIAGVFYHFPAEIFDSKKLYDAMPAGIGTMKETEVIPYNVQGFAVQADMEKILREKGTKVMVAFVNFLVESVMEDLEQLDRNAKVFFEGVGKKGVKEFVSQLIVGTVPPKLRTIFSDIFTNRCTYSTLVMEGVEKLVRGLFNSAAEGLTDRHNKENMKIIFVSEVAKQFRRRCNTLKLRACVRAAREVLDEKFDLDIGRDGVMKLLSEADKLSEKQEVDENTLLKVLTSDGGQEQDEGSSSDEDSDGKRDTNKDKENKDKESEEQEEVATKAVNVINRLDKAVESAQSELEAVFSQDDKDGQTANEEKGEQPNKQAEKDEEAMDDSDLFADKNEEEGKVGGDEDDFIDGDHLDALGEGVVTSSLMGGGMPY